MQEQHSLLLQVVLLPTHKERKFKPEYEVNEHGVVLNSRVIFVYKHKSNKSISPNVMIEAAETTDGKWVCGLTAHHTISGVSWGVFERDLPNAKDLREAVHEVMTYVFKFFDTPKTKHMLTDLINQNIPE